MTTGDFAGFTCWTPDSVRETIVLDAVNPTDAVFEATHHPTLVLRRDADAGTGGNLLTEDEVLQDILRPSDGLLFMPITGESGSGKSHLVRWLRPRIPEADEGGRPRRIVYIAKYETTLRQVIEQIMEGMEGESFDRLRADMREATDSLDEAGGAERLLLALSVHVGAMANRDSGTLHGDLLEERELLGAGLPPLLRDEIFFSYLLREEGTIRRFVREALRGRGRDDRDEPFAFRVEDLPSDVTQVEHAGKAAQDMFRYLAGSSRLRESAADLLNEALEPAMREVFGITGRRLFDVMIDLRRALSADGLELVLLIEDFALLQGIQSDLLDSIIEAPVRGGQEVLCPIRVAMAVTSGYFDSVDTARTRAAYGGKVYSLDVPVSSQEAAFGDDDIVSLVGRYLNAARLGADRLQVAWSAREGTAQWTPNRCDDCGFRDRCHAGFGVTPERYGLYPFNRAALIRGVRATTGRTFDPRGILTRVLRATFDSHTEQIQRGRFPNGEYRDRFRNPQVVEPLDPAVEVELQRIDPQTSERRAALLELWGDAPASVRNLDPAIHEAFRLAELADVQELEVVAPDLPVVLPTTGRDPLARERAAIRAWSTGQADALLEQGVANILRRSVFDAVIEVVRWNEIAMRRTPGLLEVVGLRGVARGVHIENTQTGRRYADEPISISATPQSAAALDGLLQYRHYGHWEFEGGPEALLVVSAQIALWAAVVEGLVRDARDANLGAAVEALALGNRIVGLDRDDESEAVAVLFADPPNPDDLQVAARSPNWRALWTACVDGDGRATGRAAVQEIVKEYAGMAQGFDGGACQMLDTSAIRRDVRRGRSLSRSTDPATAIAPLRDYLVRIRERIEPAVESERERLAAWLELVALNLDLNRTATETATEVDAAFSRAAVFGMLSQDRLEAMNDVTRAFSATSLEEVARARSLVEAAELSQSEVVTRLSHGWAAVPVTTDFISAVGAELDAIERRVRERRDQFASAGEDPLATRSEIESLLTTAEQLLAAMNSATPHEDAQ